MSEKRILSSSLAEGLLASSPRHFVQEISVYR